MLRSMLLFVVVVVTFACANTKYHQSNRFENKHGQNQNPKGDVETHHQEYSSWDQFMGASLTQNTDKGLHNLIHKSVTWASEITMHDWAGRFHTYWEWYQTPINGSGTYYQTMEVMARQYDFVGHEYIQFIDDMFNSNANHWESTLEETYPFANADFNKFEQNVPGASGNQIKSIMNNAGFQSFGVGAGFGFQIYCDDVTIVDYGCGHGGGYNPDDSALLMFGGGGGIQIYETTNLAAVGGGMGEDGKTVPDDDADPSKFYNKRPTLLNQLQNQCKNITMAGGGGSGAGWTDMQMRNESLGWAYFWMTFNLLAEEKDSLTRVDI